MIITLIAISILVAAIVLGIISEKKDWVFNAIDHLSVLLMFVGGFAVIVVCIFLLDANVNPKAQHYKKVLEHNGYEKIIESKEKMYFTTDFYEDVIDYNKSLLDYEIWHENPWVNWFWNSEVYEGLEPVNLGDRK